MVFFLLRLLLFVVVEDGGLSFMESVTSFDGGWGADGIDAGIELVRRDSRVSLLRAEGSGFSSCRCRVGGSEGGFGA